MSLRLRFYKIMSFSSDVKKELCEIKCESDCCMRAESYGLLYFGRAFSKQEICLMTDYQFVAEKYKNAIRFLIQAEPKETVSKSGKITVSIEEKDSRIAILNELGYSSTETSYRLIPENIENADCCFGAFLRGAFIACGIVTDPKTEYHLEFDVAYKNKCIDLSELFNGFSAVPKKSDRNGMQIVYFKDSNHIEDILTVMGAQVGVMNFIGEKIYKDVRNNVNRKVNCDAANIKKTFAAASRQIEAILALKDSGRFDSLPSDLKELATLRLENPEMTLSELGANLSTPLSRSGVNHRLKKITEYT